MNESFISTAYVKPSCVGLYKTKYAFNPRGGSYIYRFWNGEVWCSAIDCEPMSWLTSREMFWSN